MFLTNWLMVTRIVAASVIEAVDYPTPEEFFLAFDGTNTLFMYGGSKDTSSTSNVAIYYDGYKHETGNAYPVVLSEPGEYKALVDVCGTRYLTSNVTVGAVSPVLSPTSILAFHHGNFDDVYGDGDVATAAADGHVYANTPTGTYSWGTLSARSTTSTNTTYEWTPLTDLTADVLMVAGGGGGGNWYSGGGGGAGGLVFLENGSISGQKTVVVGNGGSGATNNPLVGGGTDDIPGSNGSDTSMSGFTTAIGGGGGASYNVNGNSGGSGGGGGYNTTGGAGTNNQGYDGGDSYLNGWGGGGGGGSGGPGYDETSNTGGNGGIGTNLSSIYGVLYGDSGFFASGGGGSGGTRTNDPSPGTASQGGGTSGVSSGSASDAQKHTGGGGGGAGWNNSSSVGGDGGSGIVLLSYQYSTDQLSYNNYNKLTVANTSNANVETNLRLGANTWDIATASNIWICKPGDYKSFTVDPDAQTAYFGNVTVGTVTEEIITYSSQVQISNTSTLNSTNYISYVTPNNGINYRYIDGDNDPRFPYNMSNGTQQVGYRGFKWHSETTLYLKFTTQSTLISGGIFHTNEFTLTELTPRLEHWYHHTNQTFQINLNDAQFVFKTSVSIQLQPNTTYEWILHVGNDSIQIKINGEIVPLTSASGPYIIEAIAFGNDIKNNTTVSNFVTSLSSDMSIATLTFPRYNNPFNGIVSSFGIFNGLTLPPTTTQPSLTSANSSGTLAFHHGTFDNVYGDGDVATAAANGHVYADTPTGTYSWGTLGSVSNTTTNTTYTWTPLVSFTGDVLMVAGGGAGAGQGYFSQGGGGAGGLLHYTNQSLSGQKTIVVGNGGIGGINTAGSSGNNTLFTGLTTVIGGGGGGSYTGGTANINGKSGGSGGGGGYTGNGGSGTAGPPRQGYNGANSWGGSEGGGGGGGGAGGAGNIAAGGIGMDFSTQYGTKYGDGGWFASGGGGTNQNSFGSTSQGGGSSGNNNPAQKHTGGGGGGTFLSGSPGNDGGSGIVLISDIPENNITPSLTYDGYNKLTTFGGYADQTLYKDSNSWSLGISSSVYIAESGEYIYFTRDADTAFLANVVVGVVSQHPTDVAPSLTYDGLNSLKVTGAETSSYITYKAYESNKFLACGTDLTTYPLSKTGNYKAEIAGSSTFTLTSNVLVPATNIVPLYQYPPTDGTTSGVTGTVTADVNSIWTVSGAGYGNGLYHAQASVAATSTSVTAYHAFDSNLTVGFETTSSTIGTLRVQLPSVETVHKYVVWPKAADGNRPKSWVIEGSQDAATWTTIHTVTNSPPSLSGDIHEIYSPAAYVYYRINVLANNGGTGLEIAELVLWGDVAFSITFSDGWVTTNGSNTIPIGTSYTLPTYTSSLPVKVTGASDLDVNTAGTYKVVYTSIGIDELARRVVRQFVVEYPTLAFHYGNFDATDYNSTYATKEAAAADGFIYADTGSFTNDTFGSVAISTPSEFVYEFYLSADSSSVPVITEISSTNITLSTTNLTLESGWVPSNGATDTESHLFDGDLTTTKETAFTATRTVGQKLLTLTTNTELTNLSISYAQPKYTPGWEIVCNGTTLLTEFESGGTGSTPQPYTKTYSFPSLSSLRTQYTWTPVTAITADVLMVAGGGGGGGHVGGGGGAGGLLFNENISLSGQKTIVVGSGGDSVVDRTRGLNGNDTYIDLMYTVAGGGGGGSYTGVYAEENGLDGGSGGGGTHRGTGGLGLSGQGNSGGDPVPYDTAGGGGGAGDVGETAPNSTTSGDGGLGLNLISVYGTKYGDSGWFASGGGGGARGGSGATAGTASIGGGANGIDIENTPPSPAKTHTGGGGGGGYSSDGVTVGGSSGGSGIVIIKRTA